MTFTLKGRINEVPFSKRTSDVKQTLLDLKPNFIECDTYITLSRGVGKDKILAERKLNLHQSRKLFQDENVMTVFINNLMLEFI